MFKELFNGNIRIKVASMGAELKSLEKDGVEYIWYSRPEYWKYCAPILFPVVGTLKDKKTIINNKEYFIPQHGIIRNLEFYPIEAKHEHCLSYINKYDEETLKTYPFKYQVIISHILNEDTLTTEVEVTNLGKEEMPFNIGGHPAFNVPLYENETFEDYTIYFDQNETFSSPEIKPNATLDFNKSVMEGNDIDRINLKKDLFSIDTIIIQKVKSRKIKLLNKKGQGIEFSYPKFPTLAVWTPYNEAPFVCLEPWYGYNDHYDTDGQFIKKDNIILLKEKEKFTISYSIKIIS